MEFAKVLNNKVIDVIKADLDFIENHADKTIGKWVQTDVNTRGGIHYGLDGLPDGGTPIRGNYAGIDQNYDDKNDVFYDNRPYDAKKVLCESWTISAPDWTWKPPISKPTNKPAGKGYEWDETTQSWLLLDLPV
jgi:hypothetical protein